MNPAGTADPARCEPMHDLSPVPAASRTRGAITLISTVPGSSIVDQYALARNSIRAAAIQ